MVLDSLFAELVAVLLASAACGALALLARQPLATGFIAAGVLLGPSVLGWLRSSDEIHTLSAMGLALLLFVVGLRLDVPSLRAIGTPALIAGMGQVVATAALGFVVAVALGYPALTAAYVAAAISFSSTVIVVKMLTDRREADSLHGRLALGILIVQDLVVVLLMAVLSAGGAKSGANGGWMALLGVVALAGLAAFAVGVLSRALDKLSSSGELLVLTALGWALLCAWTGEATGIGKEVGAFVAGVSLASAGYRDAVGAKLAGLRDFLLLFFFVELGAKLDLAGMGAGLVAAAVLSLLVLLGKPAIIMGVLGAMGYRRRTRFLTAASLAQTSEFSLILVGLAAGSGYVGEGVLGVVTLTTLVTVGVSGYLVRYSDDIYRAARPWMERIEDMLSRGGTRGRGAAATRAEEAGGGYADGTVIIFGLGGYGTNVAAHLREHGRPVLGVDFDPEAVRRWKQRGWQAVFGDAEDVDFAEVLPLARAGWVVCAIPEAATARALAHAVREGGYGGPMAFAVRDRETGEAELGGHVGLLLSAAEDAAAQAVDLMMEKETEIARKAMQDMIDQMRGHYIICGYGRMGQQICRDLKRARVQTVVVEDNPEQIPRLRDAGVPHVVGEATHDEVLTLAGVERATGLIAVAASDEENVFIVLTARGMNSGLHIVARSIREENEVKLRRAGATRVMSPYILGGRRIAAAVTHPGITDFLDLVVHSDNVDIEMAHLRVPAGAPCVGMSLSDAGVWQTCGATVLAVESPGIELAANPCADYVLAEGVELYVMGSAEQIGAVITHLGVRPVPDLREEGA